MITKPISSYCLPNFKSFPASKQMQWACDDSINVHNCRGRDRQWLKGIEGPSWGSFTSIRHLWSYKSDCFRDAQRHKIQRTWKSEFPSVKNHLGYSTGWHTYRNRDWEPLENDFHSGYSSACSEIMYLVFCSGCLEKLSVQGSGCGAISTFHWYSISPLASLTGAFTALDG